MFEKALAENREAIYAILASSSLPPEAATPSGGTAFMIAPGLLVTAARCVHGGSDPGNPPRTELSLVRAPDIGRGTERATLVSLDRGKGLALLRIAAPRSAAFLRVLDTPVPIGTQCAYSGFPRLAMDPAPLPGASLIEMFQGAYVSSFERAAGPGGEPVSYYVTDAPLVGDASGCPGYTSSGEVFGMLNCPPGDIRSAVPSWVPSMDIVSFALDNGVPLPART
ncbi:serine protease [Candidatus Deferrimicrobium sp.]|uniref:S1 family peptidase n=1 Tax=Candidatus Deferrimicrobium sp. TaxID=3060586 RepID=UPI002ED8C648